MKITLILFGKPMCNICEAISEAIKDFETEYNVLRIDTLSFFSKNGQVKDLDIDRSIVLINNFLQYLGQSYAALFKYNPETKKIGYIDISKFFNVALIDKSFIKYEDLKDIIDNSPYGVWPPPKKE
nr:glutaredoxin-like protein [Wadden Sea poxvirus]